MYLAPPGIFAPFLRLRYHVTFSSPPLASFFKV